MKTISDFLAVFFLFAWGVVLPVMGLLWFFGVLH